MSNRVLTLVAGGEFSKLLSCCEEEELLAAHVNSVHAYSVHLLAYLIENDLENARFLWKRIPSEIKKNDPQLLAVWEIFKQMWYRDYAALYVSLNAYTWDELHEVLITKLTEEFKRRTLELISRAFDEISITSLSLYLGVSSEEAVAIAQSVGWTEKNGFFVPVRANTKVSVGDAGNLQSLAEFVVYLETDFSVVHRSTNKGHNKPLSKEGGSSGKVQNSRGR
eukprot:TRINITY_DN4793_c0_g2_i3.p1 TRINITY_DN4793_c0_g2~~TRINITY_DN4793_c0_g2_i3.p1  ORF type:complete len:223 (+),score=31.61 TRINITY_DN4793_c0_g2_i3:145-813(+)